MRSRRQARLFYLNLKLAALRFHIVSRALGGLMFNALILIATGALLIGAVILWRKYQNRFLHGQTEANVLIRP